MAEVTEVTTVKKNGSDGLAITALVLGIVAFLFGWTGLFGLLLAVVAIVFSIIALVKKQHKGMSITGLVLSGIAFLTAVIFTIISFGLLLGVAANLGTSTSPFDDSNNTSEVTEQSEREVKGERVTLGAGTFTVGEDVEAGVYDVTTAPGQTGNLISTAAGINEILGTEMGVSKVRAHLEDGDDVRISGMSQVTFTPVTAKFVKDHKTVTLYAGKFIVGQDIGEGRYKVTPGAGESGNFITTGGINEILGSQYGVSEVTATLKKGEVITLSGLNKVVFTAL